MKNARALGRRGHSRLVTGAITRRPTRAETPGFLNTRSASAQSRLRRPSSARLRAQFRFIGPH